MQEIRYLRLAEALSLAGRILAVPAETLARNERTVALLDSALAAPRAGLADQDAYPTLEAKIAILGWHIARNHPLPDGNKRLALMAMLVMARRNGHELRLRAPAREDGYLRAVAGGALDEAQVTSWVTRRLVPTRAREPEDVPEPSTPPESREALLERRTAELARTRAELGQAERALAENQMRLAANQEQGELLRAQILANHEQRLNLIRGAASQMRAASSTTALAILDRTEARISVERETDGIVERLRKDAGKGPDIADVNVQVLEAAQASTLLAVRAALIRMRAVLTGEGEPAAHRLVRRLTLGRLTLRRDDLRLPASPLPTHRDRQDQIGEILEAQNDAVSQDRPDVDPQTLIDEHEAPAWELAPDVRAIEELIARGMAAQDPDEIERTARDLAIESKRRANVARALRLVRSAREALARSSR